MRCCAFVLLLIGGLAAVFPAVAETLQPRTDMLRSTEWVAERLGDEDLVVFHVAGDPAQYLEAHVPGARFLAWDVVNQERGGIPGMLPPAEELAASFENLGIDGDSAVIFYDEEGGFRAARAYMALDYLGAGDNAALMDGHWPLWEREGRPVADEPAPAEEGAALRGSIQPFVIGVTVMQDIVWANENGRDGYLLVDARPRAEYQGAEPGDAIERPGHIPGAVNVFWQETLVSLEEPILREPEELLELYGLDGDVHPRLVTYCRTGGQAAHAYFTLRYLGFDPSVYDGSYIEWQGQAHLPVEQEEAS